MWHPFVTVLANESRICGVPCTEENGSSGRSIDAMDGYFGGALDLGKGLLEVGLERMILQGSDGILRFGLANVDYDIDRGVVGIRARGGLLWLSDRFKTALGAPLVGCVVVNRSFIGSWFRRSATLAAI